MNALGHPVELKLTAAQKSDITQAEELLANHEPEVVIADKGSDSDELVAEVQSRGAVAVIPPRKNRINQREIDWHLYRARGIVEWFWSKLKQYRRVATRYEKKAQNFLAFAQVASIMVILR